MDSIGASACPAPAAAWSPIPDGSAAWVLVVEEDARLREQLVRWLRGAEIPAYAVDNGVEALRFLLSARSRPSMLIVDTSLPHLDGISLLKLLHLQADLAAIPFILLSPESVGWRERARGLKAVAHLQNPVERSVLLARIAPYFQTAIHHVAAD
ncbi:MAG: response regulator [Polyangia bacterium]